MVTAVYDHLVEIRSRVDPPHTGALVASFTIASTGATSTEQCLSLFKHILDPGLTVEVTKQEPSRFSLWPMKKYRFYWGDDTKNESEGLTVEDAYARLGFGPGAGPSLDYFEEIK